MEINWRLFSLLILRQSEYFHMHFLKCQKWSQQHLKFNSIQYYLCSAFYDTIIEKQLYRKLNIYCARITKVEIKRDFKYKFKHFLSNSWPYFFSIPKIVPLIPVLFVMRYFKENMRANTMEKQPLAYTFFPGHRLTSHPRGSWEMSSVSCLYFSFWEGACFSGHPWEG